MFPLMGLLRVALDLQTSQALFARIFEYLDLVPAIQDAAGRAPGRRAPASGEVAFDDVVFRYPDAADDTPATLKGVSFAIEPGQYAAFVGPSGAGKTTVSYLVPRLLRRDERARCCSRATTCASCSRSRSSARSASSARRPTSSTRRSPRTCGTRSPTPPIEELEQARAPGEHPRHDRVVPRRLRHGRGRARLPALRRREAARRDRAGAAEGPAGADPRRGDQRARHRDASASCRRRWMRRRAGARPSRSRTGCRPS